MFPDSKLKKARSSKSKHLSATGAEQLAHMPNILKLNLSFIREEGSQYFLVCLVLPYISKPTK
jgi:hypothetical protein